MLFKKQIVLIYIYKQHYSLLESICIGKQASNQLLLKFSCIFRNSFEYFINSFEL